MGVRVLVEVRDEGGAGVDLAGLGVDGFVDLIRAAGPGAGAPGTAGSAVGGADSVGLLVAVERLLGELTAVRAAAVHAVALDTPGGTSTDQVCGELSVALGRSRRSASVLRDQALTLTHQPAVWAAMAGGQLDPAKALVLARSLFLVPRTDPDGVPRATFDQDHAGLLAAGLAYAREHTARQLESHLQRLLAHLDPGTLARRRTRALDRRGVWIAHNGDGTSDLSATLATEDAERIYAALRAHARTPGPVPDPTCPTARTDHARAMDHRIADALVDLVLGHPSDAGEHQDGCGVRVSTHISVTIPIDSLAGLSDTPATVNGYGVIPAEVARALAAGDTRWRHILTHRATGTSLHTSPWTYRPSAALTRHIRTRDQHCRFPGCTVPARDCDLDHLIPFPQGPTSPTNLHLLCRRHHQTKHSRGWIVTALPDNGLRWTTPLGATHDTYPPQQTTPPLPAAVPHVIEAGTDRADDELETDRSDAGTVAA